MGRPWRSGALASAVAIAMLRCSSFGTSSGTGDGGTSDANASDANPSDANPSDATAADVDAGPSYCRALVTSADAAGLPLLCADFEDGLLRAWRGDSLEELWMPHADGLLSLVPAKSSPNALRATTPTNSATRRFGPSVSYLLPQTSGFRIELDLLVAETPQDTTNAAAMSLTFPDERRLELRVEKSGPHITFETSPSSEIDFRFDNTVPLFGNWRHVVLEIFGKDADQLLRLTVDGTTVLYNANVPDPFPNFPSSARLRVGVAHYGAGIPFTFLVDNIVVRAAP